MASNKSAAVRKQGEASTTGPRFRGKNENPPALTSGLDVPLSLREVIGRMIQRHRILAEKTQKQLAADANLSLKYVGEIERGEANIKLDTLERLVKALGWDMAAALNQRQQSLNDGIRTLLRSQLEELGYYLDGIVRWLDALKPDQTPINVTDADIPAPPHLGSNPPRRKPSRKREAGGSTAEG